MARIMEIFVIANAACGIAAFLVAKGIVKKARRKIAGDDRKEDTSEQDQPRPRSTRR